MYTPRYVQWTIPCLLYQTRRKYPFLYIQSVKVEYFLTLSLLVESAIQFHTKKFEWHIVNFALTVSLFQVYLSNQKEESISIQRVK